MVQQLLKLRMVLQDCHWRARLSQAAEAGDGDDVAAGGGEAPDSNQPQLPPVSSHCHAHAEGSQAYPALQHTSSALACLLCIRWLLALHPKGSTAPDARHKCPAPRRSLSCLLACLTRWG